MRFYVDRRIWVAVAGAATALSALLVQKGLDEAWRAARHEDPPGDPSDRNVAWKDAVAWTVATGVVIGLARLAARRAAAAGWHRVTGDPPPA